MIKYICIIFAIGYAWYMNLYAMTDEAIATELGQRIAQLRLEKNLTQQQLADAIGLSRVSYGKLESGEAKLVNVIAALRALEQLQALDKAIPEVVFSPMEQLKLQGKKRHRASGVRKSSGEVADDNLDW